MHRVAAATATSDELLPNDTLQTPTQRSVLGKKRSRQKRSGMARVVKVFHSSQLFVTHTMMHERNEQYLPLPSQPKLHGPPLSTPGG